MTAASPSATIWKVGWAGVKDKWPGAYKAIKAFTIDNDEMGAMIAEVDLDGKTIDEVVADWMAANEARWTEVDRSRTALTWKVAAGPPHGPRPAASGRASAACHAMTDAADTKLVCRDVWKLFGARAAETSGRGAARSPDAGRCCARRGDSCRPSATCTLDGRRGRDLRHHGPVGLGQIDAGALPVAADRADGGRDPVQRPRTCSPPRDARDDRDPPPQDGHGVPALRAAAASDRARQRRLPAGGAGRGTRGSAKRGRAR